jgi:valyl-tRNA synthetase
MPNSDGSIMVAIFPEPEPSLVDYLAEEQMAVVMDVTTAIRNIRGEMNIAPAAKVEAMAYGPDNLVGLLEAHADYIKDLAKVSKLEVRRDGVRPRMAASAVVQEIELFVPLEGILDFEEESRRLQKEISKLEPELARSKNKLANNGFLTRAPADIVDKERDKVERLSGKLEKLQRQLERLVKLSAEG